MSGEARAFQLGNMVIEVVTTDSGKKLVARPGKLVHRQPYRRKGAAWVFSYVERPKGRATDIRKVTKRAGRGSLRALLRHGGVRQNLVERSLGTWRQD